MFKKFFRSIQQKGQVLVFFAISVPILFLFTAVAADFGWLYFNQSRLQNAADAAVLAAAQEFTDPFNGLNGYNHSILVSNADERLVYLAQNQKVSNIKTLVGDIAAKQWVQENLGGDSIELADISPNYGSLPSKDTTESKWRKVKFMRVMYGSDSEDNDAIYYTVTLSEQLNHIFAGIIENFGFIPHLEAKAFAVVKLETAPSDPGITLYDYMVNIRKEVNYPDWQSIRDSFKSKTNEWLSENYGTTDLTTVARRRSVQAKGNEYVKNSGNTYRTETLTLHGSSLAANTGGKLNGPNKPMDQTQFNSLFVDLKVDTYEIPKDDTDKGSTNKEDGSIGYNMDEENQKVADEKILKYRIHDLINIGRWNKSAQKYEYPYKVREGSKLPDPLYVYIETEDVYADGSAANTVRQMIINVNASNMNEENRPMIFFYDGPQKYYSIDGKKEGKKQTKWEEDWRETWKHLGYKDSAYVGNDRNSLPVIVNLFENFRGVFFFPNSPVVINGNNRDFKGFVVAEKFLKLKRATDFPEEIYTGLATSQGYTYRKDDRDNEYYYKDDYYMVYYHKAAESGIFKDNGDEVRSKRYIQIVNITDAYGNLKKYQNTNQNVVRYRDVVYATGNFKEYTGNPFTDNIAITESDNIFETTVDTPEGKVTKYYKLDGNYIKIDDTDCYVKIKSNANTYFEDSRKYVKIASGTYEIYDQNLNLKKDNDGKTVTLPITSQNVQLNPEDCFIHYTYDFIKQERANLLNVKTDTGTQFTDNEKEYIRLNPMYLDQLGNVQYKSLSGDYSYNERPKVTQLHNYYGVDDNYEIIYKTSTFNIRSAEFSNFGMFEDFIDYTNLNNNKVTVNDQEETVSDVFFTTIRSSWVY